MQVEITKKKIADYQTKGINLTLCTAWFNWNLRPNRPEFTRFPLLLLQLPSSQETRLASHLNDRRLGDQAGKDKQYTTV